MKRYNRPFFIGMIVLLIVYFTIPLVWNKWQAWVERYQLAGSQTISDSVTSSLVYPLKAGEWLTFNISEGSKKLKIISNAHIRKPENISDEGRWKYILHYQLLDKNSRVIKDDLYHHQTKLTYYQNEQRTFEFGNFYLGYPFSPLDGRLILLSMPVIQQAKTLRISFVPYSPEVQEVALRLYVPAKTIESRLAAIWLRMKNKSKEKLAKNTSYPAALLSAAEKNNLLKNQWQVLGPSGIEGKDYLTKTLYVLRELEQEKLEDSFIAAGLHIDAEYPGIIPVPEQGGQLTVKLFHLDGSPFDKSITLELNWFGRGQRERWTDNPQWSSDSGELIYNLQGGLLQIKAPEPALVHAFLSMGQLPVEITPQPLTITAYDASYGIDYQLRHINNQPTSMRIDIRRIYDQLPTDEPTTLEYQWFNRKQQLVDSGMLSVLGEPSVYDRLMGKQKDLKVSDPVRYYFNVPANVSLVKLIAKRTDLLVNVYNQPYQYQKMQRVPENAFVSVDKANVLPSWFQIRPVNEQRLLKNAAVSKIAAQYRPPKDNPDLVSKQYLWQDFRPLKQTEARYILTAMSDSDYRDEALVSVYCQLQPNQINHLDFKAYGNLTQFSPDLIFLRSDKSPFHVDVAIDSTQTLDMPAIGQQGIFKLTDLNRGNHSVKVSSQDNIQWLVNYVSDCKSPTYLKRRVFKLANQQLTFPYTNDQLEDKVFLGRFYTQAVNRERSLVQVSIEPLQQQPLQTIKQDWTFTQRNYDIRPGQGPSSAVLHSHGHYLNSGENFFIPFNRDMPKGEYQINIKLKQGAPGYLGLSLVKPGVFEQRRFYRETNDQVN